LRAPCVQLRAATIPAAPLVSCNALFDGSSRIANPFRSSAAAETLRQQQGSLARRAAKELEVIDQILMPYLLHEDSIRPAPLFQWN
jgi:hypothetical protein